MDRVFVIVQARMGSSRLPGKVLRRAGSLTVLEHIARRLRRCQTPTDLIVATTVDPSDDPLAAAVEELELGLHRGPIDDVLGRYVGALAAAGAADEDLVVRVAGDCPLLDPSELDRLVREFIIARRGDGPLAEVDYLCNQAQARERRKIPWGLDVEVFTAGALRRAASEARAPGDREHVTPYLYREPGRFRVGRSDPPGLELGHLRLTVDTPEDLAVVDAIVSALGVDASTHEIAAWLATNPEIAAKNASVQQKSIAGEAEVRAARIAGRLLLARADANPIMGYGHVTRIGALLDAWTELGGRAVLVGRGIVGSSRARLLAAGVIIVDGENWNFEARLVEADALVIDGYAYPGQLQSRWREHAPLVAIDDLATEAQVADVVVNQNLGFPADRYRVAEHTRLLVGHPYVLLRREFRGRSAPSSPEPRVVVSFGGSDPAGMSEPVTAALLSSLPAGVEVALVLGPGVAAAACERLAAVEASSPRLRILHDVQEMGALLHGSLACVCAAGTTVWEAMACAVPVIAVAVADNQLPALAGLEHHRAGLCLGWHADLDVVDAGRRIAELLRDENARASLAARGRALVDGRGVYRVLDALLERMPPSPLTAQLAP